MRASFCATLFTCFLLSACSYYSPSTRSQPPASLNVEATASIRLTDDQTRLVRAYLSRSNPSSRRGRPGGLPPGIARNLARGKPVPPGIARQMLPADITAQLPGLPDGLDYLVIEGKLLLVDAATLVIRDVLLDAVM